jgi:hypothetical protein
MGLWLPSFGAVVAISGLPAVAHAQPPANPRAPASAATLIHPDPAGEAIAVGRARLAKGDCPGALEAFDAALRTSMDVTVHRDRGLCHEQLGHPFPAMDDFRVYLAAVPDAADAEDIRGRLNQLEIANGLGGTGTGGTSAPEEAQTSATGKVKLGDPFAVDANDATGKGSTTAAVAGSGDRTRAGNYEQEVALNERWDETDGSPLRRGTGLVFGVYGRGYGGLSNGMYGYGVGATLRGSVSAVSTIYGEVGYVTYSTGGDDDTGIREGGFSLGVGYEARIRLDQFVTNAIILAGTVSYERVVDSNSRVLLNNVDPRAKLGYRHVFGPGLGVEVGAEVSQPLDVSTGNSPVTYFGGTLAILVGF